MRRAKAFQIHNENLRLAVALANVKSNISRKEFDKHYLKHQKTRSLRMSYKKETLLTESSLIRPSLMTQLQTDSTDLIGSL